MTATAGGTRWLCFATATRDDRHKKKGDFDQWQREDVGGNAKAHAKGESDSRTGDEQNSGGGARSP